MNALSLSHLTYCDRTTTVRSFHSLDHPPFPCTHKLPSHGAAGQGAFAPGLLTLARENTPPAPPRPADVRTTRPGAWRSATRVLPRRPRCVLRASGSRGRSPAAHREDDVSPAVDRFPA